MMITTLVRFSGRLNAEYLTVVMQELLRTFRRFRQRIIIPSGAFKRPYWDDDPELNLANHFDRSDLAFPYDEAALVDTVNKTMNTPLDFAHPLWKLTLVDNHPAGSIIIVRVHHCIADGISLMHVLLKLTKVKPPEVMAPASVSGLNSSQGNLDEEVTPTMIQALESGGKSAAVTKPGQYKGFRAPSMLEILAAAVRIVLRPADPSTILKGPLGKFKKAVWSEPFSVPEIKKIAKYKGATVNDVMMAVVSGASRRYMELHNDGRKHNIRAFILVNMRGRHVDDELGNNFGLVFLTMPVEKADPLDRLDAIKQGMDWLKASAEYAATYLILKILGLSPKWIEDIAINILDRKGTVVATNVPGSKHELYLAGAPIETMIAWVPQSGRIGVGLSFVSYNNQLVAGLNADAGLIPDPEVFLHLFIEEYHSLQAAVAVLASS